jgi:hypothetical protein
MSERISDVMCPVLKDKYCCYHLDGCEPWMPPEVICCHCGKRTHTYNYRQSVTLECGD